MTQFLDTFSEEVWTLTYKDHKDNNVDDMFRRVAKTAAAVEVDASYWEEAFYDMLQDFKVTVGGRIYSNLGTEHKGTSAINCYVGFKPKYDQDSLEGILEVLKNQAHTLKSEGGWGMNFSFIRPRGSFIKGIGVESPGSVKYMELFDKSSDIITAGSGQKSKNKKSKGKIRKGAQMGLLGCWHPDVEEFIKAKQQPGRLDKFNISVAMYDQFMERLILLKNAESKGDTEFISKNDNWDLIFPDTQFEAYKSEWNGDIYNWLSKEYPVVVHKTISLLGLWKLIMESTYNRNDPGVIFMDRANRTHCWWYGGENSIIQAVNPCAEQCLTFGNVCNLASINLTQYINSEGAGFDLDKLSKYAKMVARFSDNICDISYVPLPEYEYWLKNLRRIGIGVMGWGSALYMLKIRFSSAEAYALQQEVMRTICYSVIEASISNAEEKGKFPLCDPTLHANSYYWDQINLPSELRVRMQKSGIRNSALFSIQPNGNTSIVANIVTGGLEPSFLPEYTRTVIVSSVPDDLKNFCPKYWEGEFKPNNYFKLVKEGTDDILKYTHNDGVVYKIDKNRGLTKEVLCEDYGVRYLKAKGEWNPSADWAVTALSLNVDEHISDMAGFARWLDSSCSKTVNVPENYPFSDFEKLYLNAYNTGYLKGITTYRAGTMTSVLSATDKKPDACNRGFEKRPKELNADVYHCKVKGEEYFCIVGLNSCNSPYEVFAGKNGIISKNVEKGTLYKPKRGHYQLFSGDKLILDNITKHLTSDGEALTRMVSMSLRHSDGPEHLGYVVSQLEKVDGDLFILSKAISRCLKKYLADGSTVKGVSCSSCGQETLIRQSGCSICSSCGYSAC